MEEDKLSECFVSIYEGMNQIKVQMKVMEKQVRCLEKLMEKEIKNKIGNYSAISNRESGIEPYVIERGAVAKHKTNFLTFSMNHEINSTSMLGFSLSQRKSDEFTDKKVLGTVQFSKSF
jgi:hypothetical protein